MKISESDLDSLAMLQVLGVLTPAEQEKLAGLVAGDEEAAKLVSQWREAAALLALSLDPVPPPPHVRAALLTAIGEMKQQSGLAAEGPEIRVVGASEGWQDFPVRGVRFKELASSTDSESVTVLMSIAPSCSYPAHQHTGPEQCLVVSGSFESAGKVRRAGDFIYAAAGSADDELYSVDGTTLLVVMARQDFARAS